MVHTLPVLLNLLLSFIIGAIVVVALVKSVAEICGVSH